MATKIPIFKDDLSFNERQSKIFGDMEKDMERRRLEWEDEVERMRKDFFNTKIDRADDKFDSLSDRMLLRDNVDDGRCLIEKDKDGNPVFRSRFDVRDYKPDEVHVKMDTNKVIVHAKHESKGAGSSVSREYNREVAIPKEVDPLALQCSMSSDGILTVEAPMPAPQYRQVKDIPELQQLGGVRPELHPIGGVRPELHPIGAVRPQPQYSQFTPTPQETAIHRQDVASQVTAPIKEQTTLTNSPLKQPTYTSTIKTTVHGDVPPQVDSLRSNFTNLSNIRGPLAHPEPIRSSISSVPERSSLSSVAERRFKVECDIEDFKPEELVVKTIDKKVVVKARREERSGNRTSTKELSREYNIPDTVDPLTVKAFFSEEGKLFIEAPYKSNTSTMTIFTDGRGSPASR